MILLTHTLAGGALGKHIGNPLIAFIAGFLSHFILDAIPHWHYRLKSQITGGLMEEDMVMDRRFLRDMVIISCDFFLGLLLSFLFFYQSGNFSSSLTSILWGIGGGVLPDALQFAFWKIKKEPLTSLQRFHEWIHSEYILDDYSILGPIFQIIFAILIIVIANYL